jgi:selenide,water dikinase
LKFGYAVTGIARRKRLLLNSGARAGDRVFLTKPLGTGILSTALKQRKLDATSTRALTAHMVRLNRDASEAAVAAGARAATDVTGFGLLGHATQLAEASGVTLALRPTRRWFLPQVLEFAAAGVVPGGLARNREFYGGKVDTGSVEPAMCTALHDPQTSGGLLVCVPGRAAARFEAALRRLRVWHVAAGEARPRGRQAVELIAPGGAASRPGAS